MQTRGTSFIVQYHTYVVIVTLNDTQYTKEAKRQTEREREGEKKGERHNSLMSDAIKSTPKITFLYKCHSKLANPMAFRRFVLFAAFIIYDIFSISWAPNLPFSVRFAETSFVSICSLPSVTPFLTPSHFLMLIVVFFFFDATLLDVRW